MRCKFLLLFFCLGVSASFAKPSTPLDTNLSVEKFDVYGDTIEYHLTFRCQPWVKIDKVIFNLKLPKGYTLEDGFNYWEGEIKVKTAFERSLTIRGPSDKSEKIFVNAKVIIDDTESYKSTEIKLGKEEASRKTKLTDVDFRKQMTGRRSRKSGTISRE